MRHLRQISVAPAPAQVNVNYLLNAIGLFTAFLSLLNLFADTFGVTLPQKNNPDPMDD